MNPIDTKHLSSDYSNSTLAKKPLEHIQILLDAIAPYGEKITSVKGEVLRYQTNGRRYCYLLESGSISLNRRGDGMVLNSERSPFIMGISNQSAYGDRLYVRALEKSSLIRLPLERFNLLLEKFSLWESTCALLIYTSSRIFEHCTMITQMSSYDIVKFHLNQLMHESPSYRTSITAANYIKERTYLSRSSIMRIISDIKSAGLLSIEKGVLIDLKPLPLKY
ncbi:helix-turn-helix domain-containing protein [Citrobacter youngae]|nr:helix-turn-helix domain-containing protein [Citrobacter youngae]